LKSNCEPVRAERKPGAFRHRFASGKIGRRNSQAQDFPRDDKKAFKPDYLKRIKEIGLEQKNDRFEGNTRRFGELLDEHGKPKSSIPTIRHPAIDNLYQVAKSCRIHRRKSSRSRHVGAYWLFYVEAGPQGIAPRCPCVNTASKKSLVFRGSRVNDLILPNNFRPNKGDTTMEETKRDFF